MQRETPISTRTYNLFPSTTLFRTLVYQFRRQRHRHVAWKREIGEVKFGRPQLGRRHPDQDREQMARLRKLLTELWNFAAIGLILALRVEHFDQARKSTRLNSSH